MLAKETGVRALQVGEVELQNGHRDSPVVDEGATVSETVDHVAPDLRCDGPSRDGNTLRKRASSWDRAIWAEVQKALRIAGRAVQKVEKREKTKPLRPTFEAYDAKRAATPRFADAVKRAGGKSAPWKSARDDRHAEHHH